MSVLLVDDFLDSSWHEDIAVLVQQVLTGVRLSSRESNDCSVLNFVVFEFLKRKRVAKKILSSRASQFSKKKLIW